ncbi:hypothetical protein D6D05_00940 [Aureobasidium pullulans]|nr:hypothetical protein D6D05_00940 [Aureobasidium pullulans]
MNIVQAVGARSRVRKKGRKEFGKQEFCAARAARQASERGKLANHSQPNYRLASAIGQRTVSDNEASQQILAKQRLNRPVSPHLGIYKPQITWYGSALNRVTGVALSGTFYLFGLSYLIAPAFGWHVESASIAAAFAAWPAALAILAKLVASFPFTYHSFNGLRHLMWDMGKGITNKQVQVTGWSVVGLSVFTSLVLALL